MHTPTSIQLDFPDQGTMLAYSYLLFRFDTETQDYSFLKLNLIKKNVA